MEISNSHCPSCDKEWGFIRSNKRDFKNRYSKQLFVRKGVKGTSSQRVAIRNKLHRNYFALLELRNSYQDFTEESSWAFSEERMKRAEQKKRCWIPEGQRRCSCILIEDETVMVVNNTTRNENKCLSA